MAVTLTEAAARHVNRYLGKRGKGVGVRLGVKTTGCSGLAYKLEYVDELTPDDVEPLSALVVEVWPSMFDGKPHEGEFKDQAQVRSTAEALAQMDEAGDLAQAFGPPKDATPELIAQVEQEEGWILGV